MDVRNYLHPRRLQKGRLLVRLGLVAMVLALPVATDVDGAWLIGSTSPATR